MQALAHIDYPVAMGLAAYGVVCWLAGWHSSIRCSGQMYDEGYRAGYAAGTERREKE